MNNNYQRKNSKSNSHVGNAFEDMTFNYFIEHIDGLTKKYALNIGLTQKKPHNFDLGSKEEKVIIECKSHTWTASGNVPSAKMTTWDQAMLYFHLAPKYYRKIFVVKKDYCKKRNKTLCEYYLKNHSHLIPKKVEFWELDEETGKCKRVTPKYANYYDSLTKQQKEVYCRRNAAWKKEKKKKDEKYRKKIRKQESDRIKKKRRDPAYVAQQNVKRRKRKEDPTPVSKGKGLDLRKDDIFI